MGIEMSLKKPDNNFKLKFLMASRTREQLLQIIQNYNDYCKQEGLNERMLKGYSKKPYNTKEGLIDFIIERLSDEEKVGILSNIEGSYIRDLFNLAEAYIENTNDREKLETVSVEKNTIKLKFKGWQWENEIEIEVSANGILEMYNCSCRIGQMDGFCPHLATGILFLMKENKFNPDKFLVHISQDTLNYIKKIKVEIKKYEDLEVKNADIVLGDDYLISVNGNLVTLQWGGSRPGKSTKDVTEESKSDPVDLWVAKKVVDKILAPLRDHPVPREIMKDNYRVVQKILENDKLTKKLIEKFKKINIEEGTHLPENEKELEQFLKQHL